MKKIRPFSKLATFFLATIILVSSCASSTMIRSKPSGAKVYLNGMYVGKTPYRMTDTKISGTCTEVQLTLGDATRDELICRNEQADVGAIVGGILFLVPFLWTMGYYPEHTYEFSQSTYEEPTTVEDPTPLPPAEQEQLQNAPPKQPKSAKKAPGKNNFKSKADKLWELKQLLDAKVITKEEFEKEKKKILDEK